MHAHGPGSMGSSGQRCSPMAHANCLGLNHCEQRARQLVGDGARQEDLRKVLRDEYGRLAAAVRKLQEEVLKKYTKYNTPAWSIKFSSNFLNVAEMSAKDLDEAQRVRARSSSAPPPGPLHGTEATARRN